MSRLVLRIALGILFVLMASAAYVRWGTVTLHRSVDGRFSDLVDRILQARTRVETARPADLPREIERLRVELGHPVRAVDAGEPSLPPRARRHPRSHIEFGGLGRRPGWTLYLPVRGGTTVLVLGPVRLGLGRSYPIEAVAGAILATIGLTAFLLAAPLVRRLRSLERAAARIGEGDLAARAEASGGDTIGRVARRFNAMAERVQGLLEGQRGLLQAVSHELRTPASRIRFGLEFLAAAGDDDERRRRAEAIEEDLDELDRLVEELLLYMRVGESALALERAPLEVDAELAAVLERATEARPEIEVDRALAPGCAVDADARYFRRALQNLIANGLRHARARLAIEVAPAGDGLVAIAVLDDGPGVPPADRERIFEPFARLDDSRSRASGGAGLGLAIVRRIVVAHGGAIEVAEAALGGAAFRLLWPAAAGRRT